MRTIFTIPTVVLVASLGFETAGDLADSPADIVRIGGRLPQEVILTRGETLDARYPITTEMGRMLAGVERLLDEREIRRLAQCTLQFVSDPGSIEPAFVAHLRTGEAERRIEFLRVEDEWIARDIDVPGRAVLMNGDRLAPLVEFEPRFRGSFDAPPEIPPGAQGALTPPYVPSPVQVTRRLLLRRIYGGMPVRIDDSDRILDDERFHVYVPHDYDPREPAGLVVWSSPTPDGRIPGVFIDGLDEMNLVCVGIDNAGNHRDTQDRLQLHFDAVANAMSRFHIDRSRVYIVGMSGGGKVSSILGMCFPEVFAGSMPIVGLGTHHQLNESWGAHGAPYFARPATKVLDLAQSRPMAVMSGPPDFNYREMRARYDLLVSDGFQRVRFFDHPEMGHVMPNADQFREAIMFIDRPYQSRVADRLAEAQLLLDEFRANPADHPDRPAALAAIIEAAPWSEAAWEAIALLIDPGQPSASRRSSRSREATSMKSRSETMPTRRSPFTTGRHGTR